MIKDEEPVSEDSGSVQEKPKDSQGRLPFEFWAELIEQPRCKTDGTCDGCGRCEH